MPARWLPTCAPDLGKPSAPSATRLAPNSNQHRQHLAQVLGALPAHHVSNPARLPRRLCALWHAATTAARAAMAIGVNPYAAVPRSELGRVPKPDDRPLALDQRLDFV